MPATQEAVRTTQEIADRLVQLCREGKYEEAQNELFSDDAESIEPPGAPGLQSVKGIDQIKKKGEDFNNMLFIFRRQSAKNGRSFSNTSIDFPNNSSPVSNGRSG